MKKLFFLLLICILLLLDNPTLYSQITYVWVGTGGDNYWSTALNWSPARNTIANTDIIQFNTGNIITVASVPIETIGQFFVSNNTNVTLQAQMNPSTLTISGGSGIDFVVAAGSQLNANGTNPFIFNLNSGVTGSISGYMTFTGGQHRLTAVSAGAITFQNGSIFTSGTGFAGNAFGTTNLNSVIFASGSTYVYLFGSNPFGASQPASVVTFQTGSLYSHQSTGAPSFSGRTYANFELNIPSGSITVIGGAKVQIDNLTLTSGNLNFNMTSSVGHSIKGNISLNSGTFLHFKPLTAGTINLNGSSAQTISGSGTMSIDTSTCTLVISNTSGVILNSNMIVTGGALQVTGILYCGTNIISGTGSFSLSPAASLGIGSTSGISSSGPSGNIQVSGTRTFEPAAIYIYNGTSAQVTGNGLPNSLNYLTINNSAGVTLSNSTTLNSTLILSNGNFNNGGSNLTLANGVLITRDNGSLTVPPFFTTGVNVTYTGTTGVTTGSEIPISSTILQNLTINKSGGVTLGSDLTVNGVFTFISGNMTINSNTLTINNTINDLPGSMIGGNSSNIILGGLSGTKSMHSVTNGINNLAINKPNGITLADNLNVTGTLSLLNGIISTDSYILTLGSSTSSTGNLIYSSGVIIGKFKRWFCSDPVNNILFPIGTNSNYRPVTISFTSPLKSGGTLTVSHSTNDPGNNGNPNPVNDNGYSIDAYSPDGYWQIDAADGLNGGIYNIDITADGFNGVASYNNLHLLKRANSMSDWRVNGVHIDGTGNNTTPIVHRTGIMDGFSQFAIGSNYKDNPLNGPLPVEIISLNSTVNNRDIILNWTTAWEINNKGFEIEKRDINNYQFSSWEKILFIKGIGTTNSVHNYNYIDKKLNSGKYQYRLKQIDYNGNAQYFDLKNPSEIEIGSPGFANVFQNYPNPSNPKTKIDFQIPFDAKIILKVYDITGRIVSELINNDMKSGYYTIDFDGSNLASGIYFYKFTANGTNNKTRQYYTKTLKMLNIK